ncbi:MAG: iron ABC transporter permease [Gammaproteobacteria bacterium]|nr:iron ABC transporter permease [Gammaproteobacteria bacterium]
MSRNIFLFALIVLTVIVMLMSISIGSASFSLVETLDALSGNGSLLTQEVIFELRLPRSITAFATGAALAVAGVMLQVLLRNPLADPYILGTSGGAAAAALTAMTLGASGFILTGSAFIGALGSTLLVFAIARSGGNWAPGRLLLTGVVTASGWGALITLLLALAPDANLRGMLFWLMGDFSFASNPWPATVGATIAVVSGLTMARSLNVLATGHDQASLLGVAVGPLRVSLYLISSLLTAIAVTTGGTVGFVGLVIPHLIRLITGADHRMVIPCSALAGGTLLVAADLIARTIVAPQQLPVGAITAAIGVPLFLLLLRNSQTSRD